MPFRSRLELVTCLEGSAVVQQIESPLEEMSDEIGVTMRALIGTHHHCDENRTSKVPY